MVTSGLLLPGSISIKAIYYHNNAFSFLQFGKRRISKNLIFRSFLLVRARQYHHPNKTMSPLYSQCRGVPGAQEDCSLYLPPGDWRFDNNVILSSSYFFLHMMSSKNANNLTPSFPIRMPNVSCSHLTVLARTSSTHYIISKSC